MSGEKLQTVIHEFLPLLSELNHPQTIAEKRTTEEIEQSLKASSIPSHPEKKVLDDFLPDDNFTRLQQLSRELNLEPYPTTGIVDIYYTLHTQQRSLFDELKGKKEEE